MGDRGQGDHHDFSRQNQVGTNGATDDLFLGFRPLLYRWFFLVMLAGKLVPDLLRALKGQIGAAHHQDYWQ